MKTPDEIKKGLECCTNQDVADCNGCPYLQDDAYEVDWVVMEKDALAYIQQFERERDAAVEDINEAAKTGGLCHVCHRNDKGYCRAFEHGIFECVVMCGQYKWRGVEVERWKLDQ